MRNMSNTISRLAAQRRVTGAKQDRPAAPMIELVDFGSNPGCLRAWVHLPRSADPKPPLVVVLHGCTQNAAAYDRGAGWSELAEELGFVLLFPEQRRANNLNLCFNWYEPAHQRRDAGEPLSIKHMIDAVVERHDIDSTRIYINGLSAGGAMTSVMLATYPDLFAGGAIIAGLPFGSAANMPEAFDRMRGHGGPGDVELASAVRRASPHKGPWPTVSVWHGNADHIVDASNADRIVAQWRAIHGLPDRPSSVEEINGFPHSIWRDDNGVALVEHLAVTGMGHGTPISTTGPDACGKGGPHFLEAGISSTRCIAASWGLRSRRPKQIPMPALRATDPTPRAAGKRVRPSSPPRPSATPSGSSIAAVINDALRKAGLLR